LHGRLPCDYSGAAGSQSAFAPVVATFIALFIAVKLFFALEKQGKEVADRFLK